MELNGKSVNNGFSGGGEVGRSSPVNVKFVNFPFTLPTNLKTVLTVLTFEEWDPTVSNMGDSWGTTILLSYKMRVTGWIWVAELALPLGNVLLLQYYAIIKSVWVWWSDFIFNIFTMDGSNNDNDICCLLSLRFCNCHAESNHATVPQSAH